jgi:hypothetical protein
MTTLEQIALKYGPLVPRFPRIGRGSTRAVYELGDYVVKVCLSKGVEPECDRCACKRETEKWESLNAHDPIRALLAPILASGDCWVVMPKADQIDGDIPARVSSVLAKAGFCDMWGFNFGRFGDEWKMIDYAA